MGRIVRFAGGLATGGALIGFPFRPGLQRAAASSGRFLIEGVREDPEGSIKTLVRRVLEESGGLEKIISRGDLVALKPNISWARKPALGATTHPDVLEALVEACFDVGAAKVHIADNTIHDARQCFYLTGAGAVARKTGAKLVYPRASLMRRMKIGGGRLDVWPVFLPLVEADTLINVPVAKQHSLSGLTLGMKNWIGGVGGSRWALHQDIHQSIVDLAQFFEPALTVIDAIRIMTRNGPSGGSSGDVSLRNTLLVSNDPVAADAAAATLFGRQPATLGFIRLGERAGLGSSDPGGLERKRVAL